MGLDNGITFKCREINNGEKLEVAYWRKCWSIRNTILWYVFWEEYKSDANIYEFKINAAKMNEIIKICEEFRGKNWSEEYWTWEEYRKSHKKNIKEMKKTLRILKKLEEKGIGYECIFYDSY